MRVYIVSKRGTFGKLERRYLNGSGEPSVVIRWRFIYHDCFTPVLEADTKLLKSTCEGDAWVEAQKWLKTRKETDSNEG